MSRCERGLPAEGQVGFAVRFREEVRTEGKSLPSLPAWVRVVFGGARVVVVSVLTTFVGGCEGGGEAGRSWARVGFEEAGRGGGLDACQ